VTGDVERIDPAERSAFLEPGPRSVFVHVADSTLARVLCASVDDKSWVVVDGAREAAVLVTDDLVRDASLTRSGVIEVVLPLPRCAHLGVDNVMSGMSQAVVLADEPGSLADALGQLVSGEVFASARAVALRLQFPAFSARQDSLLLLLARGASTKTIVRQLDISVASVQREIAVVEDRLGVKGRPALAVAAVLLGFPPR
jgi:DNA-binding CsgD family transcriptional regulator